MPIDVTVSDPEQPVREAVQHVWTRFTDDLPVVAAQALLSWATDHRLIGTAMLPQADIDQSQAHRTAPRKVSQSSSTATGTTPG